MNMNHFSFSPMISINHKYAQSVESNRILDIPCCFKSFFFFRLDSLQLRVSETLLNVCKSIFYDIAVSALTYSGTVYPQMNGKKLYLLDVLIAYALSYFLL